MKKKKEIVISTVTLTTLMLMASVSYSCSKQSPVDDNKVAVESQVDSPEVISYNKEVEVNVGESLSIDMLKIKVDSKNEVKYDLPKTKYDKLGDVTETVEITDKVTGMSTEIKVKVKVVDKLAPKIKGTNDIVVTEGDAIDLMNGVSAKDNLDGDITKSISVSEYDASLLDKDQKITYSVKDKEGNKATKTVTLHIKSNPVEALDKVMYSTSSVNLRDSSSSNGAKVGSLGYAQEVHVTGRDKNTGWYRIDNNGTQAWVSDSYLSDTKPQVQTPQNNKSNSSSSTSTSKPSDCQANCDCDCATDCQADCDNLSIVDCNGDCPCGGDCDCSACGGEIFGNGTLCDCGDCWVN